MCRDEKAIQPISQENTRNTMSLSEKNSEIGICASDDWVRLWLHWALFFTPSHYKLVAALLYFTICISNKHIAY